MNFLGRLRAILPASLATFLCCVAVGQAPVAPSSTARSGAYFTGQYRNLFAGGGHSESQVWVKLDDAYRQLFHGDPQTQSIYFAAGHNPDGDLAYILNPGDGDVRSEGMSYGMMVAVQLNHKADFDALWNWAMTYMYIGDPSRPSFGYFAWTCEPDGKQKSDTAAPDGEEYFAMPLYFASARWGDGKGIYAYRARADELLRTMLHHKTVKGTTAFGDREVGAEFSEEQHMVRFLPEPGGRDFTDPSYHLPGFYELWGLWGPPEDRAFWKEAARVSRAFFVKAANQATGLTPVYANFDGSPHATDFQESASFGHDSWRVASNWSWDWSWFQSSSEEQLLSDRLQSFFASQGTTYGQVFTLDGKPTVSYSATGLVAANAVASLAATPGPRSRQFVDALWQLPIPTGRWRYYDGMLYILSLLHVGAEFKAWIPPWAEPSKR